MNKTAVIVAGGAGTRMGNTIPKQFLLLKGKPVLYHTIQSFLQAYDDMQIILVLPEEHLCEGEKIANELNASHRITLVKGGQTRFHSVQNGLQQIKNDSVVFVHDGVRCMISTTLIQNCYTQALEKGSAIPAIAATDSIRIIKDGHHEVANRDDVRIIQTPQTFRSDILLPAFEQPYSEAFTDEATVVEAWGQKVFLIEGEHSNIKITRPIDLIIAEATLI